MSQRLRARHGNQLPRERTQPRSSQLWRNLVGLVGLLAVWGAFGLVGYCLWVYLTEAL